MRRLNKSVLVGGVVYPAGLAATPELEAVIKNSAHWDGDPAPEPEPVNSDPYKGWKNDQLKGEIDARNADRDPEGDTYIVPEEPGNKPEMLAALRSDDARGTES